MRECWRHLFKPRTSGSREDKKTVAERDIRRLKWNWAFLSLLCSMISISYVSPLSTIHQFIINPTSEGLNKTDEVQRSCEAAYRELYVARWWGVMICHRPTCRKGLARPKAYWMRIHVTIRPPQKMEPGLQQSEAFYSWALAVLFIGFTVSSVVTGILTNWIPYWYLFFSGILENVVGYVLYALATNGWMMILGRLLAGASMGSVFTLTFTYFGVSFETYVENVKTLEKYEEKKAARVKGYVFSLHAIGNTLGHILGAGFPTILAKFDVPHFRAVGWFNVAAGVILLLLEVVMFQGEWKENHAARNIQGKTIMHNMRGDQLKCSNVCKYFVSCKNLNVSKNC